MPIRTRFNLLGLAFLLLWMPGFVACLVVAKRVGGQSGLVLGAVVYGVLCVSAVWGLAVSHRCPRCARSLCQFQGTTARSPFYHHARECRLCYEPLDVAADR